MGDRQEMRGFPLETAKQKDSSIARRALIIGNRPFTQECEVCFRILGACFAVPNPCDQLPVAARGDEKLLHLCIA